MTAPKPLPLEKLKPCICNSKSSSFRPPVCRKKGCDGILTEGIMRQCSRYISEDDPAIREAVWRAR